MNRGEVWWLEHPGGGRRPVCILTQQAAIPVLNALFVVPATGTVRAIPTEVALGREDGMPDDCALTFDNLGVVPTSLLTERITRLRPAKLAELCASDAGSRPSPARPSLPVAPGGHGWNAFAGLRVV